MLSCWIFGQLGVASRSPQVRLLQTNGSNKRLMRRFAGLPHHSIDRLQGISVHESKGPKGRGELEAVHLNLLFAQHPQRAVAMPLRNLKRACPKFAMARWLVIIFPIEIAISTVERRCFFAMLRRARQHGLDLQNLCVDLSQGADHVFFLGEYRNSWMVYDAKSS